MTKGKEVIPAQSELWQPAAQAKPVDLEKLIREYELGVPHMKAEELVGEKFTIVGLSRVQSDLPGPGYYYFCECVDLEEKEAFTTTLGGQVLLELFDAILEKGVKEPFTVTLDFVKGGQFEGYYIFR